MQVKEPVDIVLSHDWPAGVTRYGDARALYKNKPYFKAEDERGELGSPPAWQLLEALAPRFWFSGHLHTAFAAAVPHKPGGGGAAPPSHGGASAVTRFMATDKPLPRRRYVQARPPAAASRTPAHAQSL
jgi:lariat debranching enzyme